MTTRIRTFAIRSFLFAVLIGVGIASLGASPASAQTFAPDEKIMILNVAGAVGRMADFSIPGAPVFIQPPNVTQQRLLWKFKATRGLGFAGGWYDSYKELTIANITSAQDSTEELSPQGTPTNGGIFNDGSLIVEIRKSNTWWDLVRVPNLPFYQLRGHNFSTYSGAACLSNQPQAGQLLFLASCNPGDSRQWYTLMNDKGTIK